MQTPTEIIEDLRIPYESVPAEEILDALTKAGYSIIHRATVEREIAEALGIELES